MKKLSSLFGPMGVGGGAVLLAMANLASYGAGLLRDLVLANIYGATAETDAYFAAFLIPDFLFNFLVLGFVSGALLPVFHSAEDDSPQKAEKLFQSFLSIIILTTTFFSIIAFALAPYIVEMLFGVKTVEGIDIPRDSEELSWILEMTRVLLLSPILFGISNTLGMILLAKKRFVSMAISPVLYNLGIILGILFFGKLFGIEAAAWGAVAGATLHLLSRLLDFPFTGVRIVPFFQISEDLKKIFWLGLPKTLGLISFQFVLITFAYIAGRMEDGALSAWNFARNVQSLPVSLFGIAFATAAFPFLSEYVVQKNPEAFLHRIQKTSLQMLFFAIPAAVGLILVGKEAIGFLFEHGNFTENAKYLTVSVLIGIAVSIPFESLTHLFSRSFLAYKNTIFPACGKILFLIVAASTAFLGAEKLGVAIFGIAFSLAAITEILFLTIVFHFFFQRLALHILSSFFKILLLSLLLGGVVYGFLSITESFPDFARLGGAVFFGAAVYLGGAFFVKIPEVSEIFFLKGKKR